MNEGRRWLLCVGVNDYGSQIQFPNLHCAVNDACLIYHTLVDNYNFEGVLLVQSRDIAKDPYQALATITAGNGTREDIIGHINQLRRRIGADDVFVFFYAGHGSAKIPGYLVPFGAEQDKPGTYLMYRTLYGELSALRCHRQVLFFDCCYAGIATHSGTEAYHILDRSDAARVVAYAATRDDRVALDRVPGIAQGRFSPFAYAVRGFLVNEIAVGQAFEPYELYQYVKKRVPEATFRDEVPEIKPGREQFAMRRPGLAIDLQSSYNCRVGKRLGISLQARGWEDISKKLQWEVNEGEFAPAQLSSSFVEDGLWKLQFNSPGVIPFDVRVTNPDTRESAIKSVEIIVEPAVEQPLTLSPRPLKICKKGHPYEELLPFSGGSAPYTAEIKGLPPGLAEALISPEKPGDDAWGLRIVGQIPESAKANDASPIAYDLEFLIQDSAGSYYQGHKRLLVISLRDYCHIPTGGSLVGFQAKLEQFEHIRNMLENHARLRLRGAPTSNVVQRILRRIGHDWTHQTVTSALQTNPASQVTLAEYYIKKYPVTNAEWRAFILATNFPYIPPHWLEAAPHYFSDQQANLPVVNIKYEYIQAYLQWQGTRLPSAWEWERAARGTDGRLFPWGEDFDPQKCNVLDSQRSQLTPVNAYDHTYTSPTGTRDMAGNAAEWVDQRVYTSQRMLAQPFRGGSYLDPCIFALTFKNSAETGVLFGADEDDCVVGKTDFHWVTFRDVIDLDADPKEPQGLVEIPEVQLRSNSSPTPSFRMSRYAVSNLEYLEFLRATGYSPPAGWDEYKDIPFPMAHRYLPVVNVSYRDALAFCLWKSRCSGDIIRLPTPRQWLTAVDGGEHRMYPWGNDFDPKKCNSLTSGWGKRLPVFALPEGCSKHGIYNLIGNVREWVGSPVEVRGGRWQADCQALAERQFREPVHDSDALQLKRNDIGFRYVANNPEKTS